MRYKLKYSPDASDKLKDLKRQITASNGKDTANKILSKEKDVIYITDIYDEREDFMWKMFRIRLRSQESIDFWGE